MGTYYKFFACCAIVCFVVILYAVMFTKGTADSIVSKSKK